MPYITVGKENSGRIDLYYEDHGSGRPVVLIHGWPLSGSSWEKQVPILLEEGYRIITYDRRGFGRSDKPSMGYSYDIFAEDLHKIVTALSLEETILVGFSMGGGEVARYLATYGSGCASKAVFISAIPPFLRNSPDNPQGLDGYIFDDIRRALVTDRPQFLTRFFHDFFNFDILGGSRISDDAIRLCWNIGVAASPMGTIDCVTAWETDFRKDLSRITVPTLIIHGDSDRICPIEVTGNRMFEMIDGSRLVVVEGGPHGLTWTHAAELNHALLEFLGSPSPEETAAKSPVSAVGMR